MASPSHKDTLRDTYKDTHRVDPSFNDEYMCTVEKDITNRTVSSPNMGAAVGKLRSGNNEAENTSPKISPNGVSARPVLTTSPNGVYHSSKKIAKMRNQLKASLPNRKESNRIKMLNEKAKAARKRKFIETEHDLTELKQVAKRKPIDRNDCDGRRRAVERTSLDERNSKMDKTRVNGIVKYSPVQVARSPTAQSPIKYLSPETKSPLSVNMVVSKKKTSDLKLLTMHKEFPGTIINGNVDNHIHGQSVVSNGFYAPKLKDRVDNKDEVDGEILDQNLNNISNCIRNENLQQLYEQKILAADLATSPFKGKMSAFEISLLKGKQNLERRKSLESATLRSSPRMNRRNTERINYKMTKTKKSRLSLPSVPERLELMKRNPKGSEVQKRPRKRKRAHSDISDKVSTVQPKSTENENVYNEVDGNSGRRKIRGGRSRKTEEKQSLLNGSRRASLPSSLALSTQSSGTKPQGQSSSAATTTHRHSRFSPKRISGTPPVSLHHKDESSLDSDTFFAKPSNRPSSLSLKNRDKSHTNSTTVVHTVGRKERTESDDEVASTSSSSTSSTSTSSTSSRDRRLSLEETVNMLRQSPRQSSPYRSKDPARNHYSHQTLYSESPSPRSRRSSSRSSTPGLTPIKTELLTPRSTPCSSPDKSPCVSPSKSPSESPSSSSDLVEKKVKGSKVQRRYLFGKNDEVLARWHDGRFYLGHILKIDDSRGTCQLKYEDSSQCWSMFKDIHRVLKDDEMTCCVCLGEHSEPPNEIVLCEYCQQGYHQQCHTPNISDSKIVNPNEPWYCRQCIFFRTVQVGGAVKEGKWAEELKKVKLTLPYQMDALTWDSQHKANTEQNYCYCGGPGIWYQKMLQCCRCKQWFHEACLQCLNFPLMNADSFYIFVCSPCNMGQEYVKRLEIAWVDVVHICLFNMALENGRKYYDLSTEIFPWLQEHWAQLQIQQYDDLSNSQKFAKVKQVLLENKARFTSGSEIKRREALYGLRVRLAPPRIFVTLPFNGIVTDEVIQASKSKGRRSKVFVPIESETPVKKLKQRPSDSSDKVKKKLDCSKQEPAPEPEPEPLVEENLSLLDKLIPVKDDSKPYNHPFLLDTEVAFIQDRYQSRMKIWNKCVTMTTSADDSFTSTEDGPPVLERVEPVIPTASTKGTPPMLENSKKQGKNGINSNHDIMEGETTKGSKDDENEDKNDKKSKRRSIRRSKIPESDAMEKDDDISVKHLKHYGSYFCAFDKTGHGKGFYMMGKRFDDDSNLGYMIKWDQ